MPKIAFAWYKPEDWEKLLEISVDSDQLEDSYKEWLFDADKSFNHLRKKGLDITKIFIDLHELKSWCVENNHKINAESQSGFAAYKLKKLFS